MPVVAVTNRASLPRPQGAFVYCYLRTNSPKPYYVGKGTRRDRLTAKHAVKVPKDWSRIRILRDDLTEAEALDWERFYVDKIGRKSLGNGPLLNRRDGGEEGGNYTQEVIDQIAAKVSEHYRNGVYAALNTPEAIARRAAARLANKAAEFGIPEDAYAKLTKTRRDQAKQWLKANPGYTFDQWLARGKSVQAAAKYKLTLDEWEALTRKQKNALKEWMIKAPGADPQEYLKGLRRRSGVAPRIDKGLVMRLLASGLSQTDVAKQLGCAQPTISRIRRGVRQPDVARASS